MPSTRMIAPKPNHARRKALSFFLCFFASLSSIPETNFGFSTGERRIIEALSLLPFCFLPLVAALAFFLLKFDDDVDDDPNPTPGELDFCVGAETDAVSSKLEVGFEDSEGF